MKMTGFNHCTFTALSDYTFQAIIRLEVRVPNVMSGAKTATQGREEELS